MVHDNQRGGIVPQAIKRTTEFNCKEMQKIFQWIGVNSGEGWFWFFFWNLDYVGAATMVLLSEFQGGPESTHPIKQFLKT